MIQTFPHKGLRRLFKTGSHSGMRPAHATRLRMILTALDTSLSVEDMQVPGLRLHATKGSGRGHWSVWVNGNRRVTFEFRDGHAYVLDYEDYH